PRCQLKNLRCRRMIDTPPVRSVGAWSSWRNGGIRPARVGLRGPRPGRTVSLPARWAALQARRRRPFWPDRDRRVRGTMPELSGLVGGSSRPAPILLSIALGRTAQPDRILDPTGLGGDGRFLGHARRYVMCTPRD